jgi:hypothetical protein
MTRAQHAAVAATALLLLLALFQLLLAVGVPWGRAAWRGAHRVLPKNLRWASLAAVPVLFFAGWVVLARSDLVAPGSGPLSIRILTWAFAVYFSLNTIGNLGSKSSLEKWLMTPVAVVLAVCCFAVALS